MKKIFLTMLLAHSFTTCAQDKTIYYTKDWKVTTKDSAEFYRPKPKKVNDLWLVKDYYIKGTIQFSGTTKNIDKELWDGDVTWYYPTGKIEAKERYKNGKLLGVFSAYEGVSGNQKDGYHENDLYFYDESQLKPADAISPGIKTYKHYYLNSKQIAELHESVVDHDNKTSNTTYYNKKGNIIGKLIYDEYSEKYSGNDIHFYKEDCKYASECKYIAIKKIITYKKGKKIAAKYYSIQKQLIANGQYKKEKPYQGTFIEKMASLYKIRDFNHGIIQNETVYTKNNNKIGTVTYKNGVINNGKLYNEDYIKNYKNGKLDGKVIQYVNGDFNNIKSEFLYKNGQKNGAYKLFSYGEIIEKGTYKKGNLIGEVWYYNTGFEDVEHNPDVAYVNYYAIKLTIKNTQIKKITVYNSNNLKINEFNLAKTSADKFTYLKNGFHNLMIDDYNFDGYKDFAMNATYFYEEPAANTYYLYNPDTKLYEHYNALDGKKNLVFEPETQTFIETKHEVYDSDFSSYDDDYVEYKTNTIYQITKEGKLIKIEEFDYTTTYNEDDKKTIITQTYPPQFDKFPLLNPDLPKIAFIQNGKKQVLDKAYKEIKLRRAPFTITLPLIDNTKIKDGFYSARITASTNIEIIDKAQVGTRTKKTVFFALGTAMATVKADLYTSEEGHNALAYEDSKFDKVKIIKTLKNTILLVSFDVESIKEIALKNNPKNPFFKQPFYLLIFIDKNLNERIEERELHKVKLILKD